MVYVTKANYGQKVSAKVRGETNELPSETVPNEAKTIKDILKMYAAGQRPDQKNFQYLDANDLADIDKFHRPPGSLDFTDLEELSVKNDEKIQRLVELQEKIDQEKKDVIDDNPEVDKNQDGKIDEDVSEPKN